MLACSCEIVTRLKKTNEIKNKWNERNEKKKEKKKKRKQKQRKEKKQNKCNVAHSNYIIRKLNFILSPKKNAQDAVFARAGQSDFVNKMSSWRASFSQSTKCILQQYTIAKS